MKPAAKHAILQAGRCANTLTFALGEASREMHHTSGSPCSRASIDGRLRQARTAALHVLGWLDDVDAARASTPAARVTATATEAAAT